MSTFQARSAGKANAMGQAHPFAELSFVGEGIYSKESVRDTGREEEEGV